MRLVLLLFASTFRVTKNYFTYLGKSLLFLQPFFSLLFCKVEEQESVNSTRKIEEEENKQFFKKERETKKKRW